VTRTTLGGWLRILALACLALCCGAHAQVIELTEAVATVSVGGATPTSAKVALPYHWDRHHGSFPGDAEFTIRFILKNLPAEPWALYFPRIGNTAEIVLNGSVMARLGDVGRPNRADYSKSPQYISIPAQLLQYDNVLRIRVHADGGRRGGLSSITLGPADEVERIFGSVFQWRVSASMAVTIFGLVVGLMAFVLWLTQSDPYNTGTPRRDSIYLTAAMAEFCWALRVGDVAIVHPPLPWPWWGVVVTAAFAGWFCCIALFCHHVAGWHKHRSMPWFRAAMWALFIASIVSSTLAFTIHKPILLTAWLGLANVFFIAYACFYFAAALRKPTKTHLLVAIAGMVNVAMGVRDWVIIRITGNYEETTWIRYSSVLFGLMLGYIVMSRFRAASAQARDLMANMAARVSEKEAALGQSYARVEQLAREQERASERTRILRDMHDGVGSHISAAIRQLQSGKASSDDVLLTLRGSLDQLKLTIDSMNLPPGDVNALLANMRYRLEPRFAASDIELQWDVDLLEPLPRLDAPAMRQLQFMVFEALSNVLQHAQAHVLRIEARALNPQGGGAPGARIYIIDNGRGFDTALPPRKGLLSLQERATAIGASLEVRSQPGRTVIGITLGG
jgi:signal transduction histidine kinase